MTSINLQLGTAAWCNTNCEYWLGGCIQQSALAACRMGCNFLGHMNDRKGCCARSGLHSAGFPVGKSSDVVIR